LVSTSSFLRASSVSLAPTHIKGQNQPKTCQRLEDNTQRPNKRTINHGPEVVRGILGLLLGSLQLLFQGVHLLLRLPDQGLFHALGLLCSFDLGLQ
jgi:hypothetical protein